MGNTSSMLTQYDIEEVQSHCKGIFSQREIISLYERFCILDRSGKGFILEDEFMAVPEFALNPLAQRLLRILEGVNFKEFVLLLSAFSPRASFKEKMEFIFKVYDSDGDGKVTTSDILGVLRDLSGSFLTEKQREQVVIQALDQAGFSSGCMLTYEDFVKVLVKANLKMEVEVPVD
ncbi:hypothetical protein SELMODRAFT_169962 [Selaginella moellendorffii]|uniref:EF-hand domain-containing protein n=1 Tax=Selaginella moellendorffii TaxID=88036 RepID=D8RBL0_SELML|nr:calcineurin subunit B [Selaginella moellendorffii]XP_002976119.1 calcineurin subunit B [Selaginella moellendorffii]EFJ23024.1 hypothetical protein SELMODRAFT_104719 [Selaginella moellendorffii]EFJ30513.1 hypothetical protein SELMODRAFT_169962 [Selaginella moellendorffii]|eukprot:XP_002968259.1 calcineurin subunit B [Selaginella moellendorffii]